QDDIANPNDQSGHRPDRGRPDQFALREKQTNRQQQVSEVAHPQQVTHTADAPVVDGLREKENQGQQTQQAKAQRQLPRHLLKNNTQSATCLIRQQAENI